MDRRWMRGLLDTELTPVGEELYRQQMSPEASADYDMRGVWSQLGGNLLSEGQHYPDTFKKPNHPTFSSGSQYASPAQPGGDWAQLPGGQWVFVPSVTNANTFGLDELQRYFDRQEPNSLLLARMGGR